MNTGGQFSFTTNFAKNPIANFLLGLPNTYTEVERPVVSDVRFGALEAYVLDEFQAAKQPDPEHRAALRQLLQPLRLSGVASNFIPSLWDRGQGAASGAIQRHAGAEYRRSR